MSSFMLIPVKNGGWLTIKPEEIVECIPHEKSERVDIILDRIENGEKVKVETTLYRAELDRQIRNARRRS